MIEKEASMSRQTEPVQQETTGKNPASKGATVPTIGGFPLPFVLVITVIALGVIMVIAKTLGIV
jgi:hypothetical protein